MTDGEQLSKLSFERLVPRSGLQTLLGADLGEAGLQLDGRDVKDLVYLHVFAVLCLIQQSRAERSVGGVETTTSALTGLPALVTVLAASSLLLCLSLPLPLLFERLLVLCLQL